MKFKFFYSLIFLVASMCIECGDKDSQTSNKLPRWSDQKTPPSDANAPKARVDGFIKTHCSRGSNPFDDASSPSEIQYKTATLVGIGCGAVHHALNYLGVHEKISELTCSLAAPTVAALIAHCYFGTTTAYTLTTATASLLTCRGAIDLGNKGIAVGKKVKTTVLRLKNLSKSCDEDEEEEEEETETKTVLAKKKEKK